MIRVLFFVRSLNFGGVESQLIELVRNMDHSRFQVQVVSFYDGGSLRSTLESITDVQVMSLGKSGRWDMLSFFFKFIKMIRQHRPQVIISFLDVPNTINALAGWITGTKTILGVSASYMDFSRYDWTAAWVYRTGAFFSPLANRVISNSFAGQKYSLEHGYSGRNFSVIHNGINTRSFSPNKAEGQRMREKWGIREDEKVVGIVGRIDPMKDHPNFLRAAVSVNQQIPNTRFMCIGRGPQEYKDKMRQLAESLLPPEQVIWIDYCADKDLFAAYNAFDVLVSSSYGEGLAVVIGEAMSSGIPCVVTDVGDSAYGVGDTGIVVPAKDPQALADGIIKILSLDAKTYADLGIRARQRVVDLFSIEKMVEAYQRAFEELATNK